MPADWDELHAGQPCITWTHAEPASRNLSLDQLPKSSPSGTSFRRLLLLSSFFVPAGLNVERSVTTGVRLRSIGCPDIDEVDTDRYSSGDFSALENVLAPAGEARGGGDDDDLCRFVFIEMPSPRPFVAGASSPNDSEALRLRGERA